VRPGIENQGSRKYHKLATRETYLPVHGTLLILTGSSNGPSHMERSHDCTQVRKGEEQNNSYPYVQLPFNADHAVPKLCQYPTP